MEPLFEVKPVDRKFYENRLRAWLPDKIIDIHTHVWLDRFKAKQKNEPVRSVTWPARGLFIQTAAESEDEAKEFLKNAERWSVDRG